MARRVLGDWRRHEHWLGNGLIATAGWNARVVPTSRGPEQREAPAGLRLLDVRSWTSRMLVDGARWFRPADDVLLARTLAEGRAGTVLAGFGQDGTPRFALELDMVLLGVQSSGPHAYLGLGTTHRPHGVAVVDSRTGELVGTPDAPGWRMLVSPWQPQFCLCYTGTTVD